MSAAPLVSSAHLEDGCGFPNPTKRLRRNELSSLECGEALTYDSCMATASATFAQNMEVLRGRFPSVNEGILSSILESTGDKLNLATGLLTQLVNVRAQRGDKPARSKRRRSASPSSYDLDCGDVRRLGSDTGEDVQAANKPEAGSNSTREYLQQSASQVLLRLRGVRSESEAFNRLQPALSEVVQNCPELNQSKSLQRVLTKAVFKQEDRIQGLSEHVARSEREAQEWRKKALELEAINQELQRANRNLKDANNMLSYYIKSTAEPSGFDVVGGSSNPFEGGFRGPDVC
eukprot:Gregarina_sp_Pseudo_9__1088@NODE_1709_length_1379_cov_32_240299_g1584_i0_p1_GENE_NODE_1709_length_1379_cov_32_240299_g1584_i0NODE_1709_length_1379_cov_32_240299_g1584_i0_p1_ORF_typecomplete_len290_score56_83HAUS5/PF14817_6/0_0018FbpA/PF05833_11/0_051ERM/PF00769_19/0_033GvpL_GvpF/PF06386_11/0_092Herpes_UL6/PF01763_16/0_15Phage_HK97_TLTM/PF06120_11/0_29DUF16/PF01519_16/0_29DUF1090/PF06476_12/0_53DUF4337/PF14235_6/0_39WEMBL/PF05701_11/0_41Sec20/PF03908_13/1_2e04Sec20/PF03908_13/3_3e03Sec20/PF03908_